MNNMYYYILELLPNNAPRILFKIDSLQEALVELSKLNSKPLYTENLSLAEIHYSWSTEVFNPPKYLSQVVGVL